MFSKSQLPDITEREQAFALHQTWADLADRVQEMWEAGADPEATRLADAKRDEAEDALSASGIRLMIDKEGNAIRCAVSGAPILESDDTEIVLRVAVMEEVA